LEQAETAKRQSEQAQAEISQQLREAGREAQELIGRATRTGEEVRAQAQVQARQEAEKLIEKARQEIQAERDGAIDELRQEFADLTIRAASKVIGQSLDKDAHHELIDKVLKESQTLNKG